METNPLKQYFRQPAIFIRLPSGGQHYAAGKLDVRPDNEYPVLPMTTIDEITYRTPDALFNGAAVVSVIESCVPNIKDAWEMPSMDVDTVLTAIRIATYGNAMDMTTTCPNCSTESDFAVDLNKALTTMVAADYDNKLSLGDLVLHFRPMSYREINENSLKQFEEQKILQNIEQSANLKEEEKMRMLGDALKQITKMTTEALALSIRIIETPQAKVTEKKHISEWLGNCDRKIFAKVRDHIIREKQKSELQPLDMSCANCQHKYKQNYTLDMSNFFEDAS